VSQRDFQIFLAPMLVVLALCCGVVVMDIWRSLRTVGQTAWVPEAPAVLGGDVRTPAARLSDRPIHDGDVTAEPSPISLHNRVETESMPERPMPGNAGPAPAPPPAPLAPAPPEPPPGSRGPTARGQSLFDRVDVKEIGSNVYEVAGPDVWSALRHPERVLSEVSPSVRILLSSDAWPRYQINSQAVDGVLTTQGFVVSNPKQAQRAGFQPGDTIVRVNGRQVDGLASLYAISRNVRQTTPRSAIRVDIQRQGSLLTKTFSLQ
jgi:hypothetical protein